MPTEKHLQHPEAWGVSVGTYPQLKCHHKQGASRHCQPANIKPLLGSSMKPGVPALLQANRDPLHLESWLCQSCLYSKVVLWQFTGKNHSLSLLQSTDTFRLWSCFCFPLRLSGALVQWEPCHSDYIVPNLHCSLSSNHYLLHLLSESFSVPRQCQIIAVNVHSNFLLSLSSQVFERNPILVLEIYSGERRGLGSG